MALSILSIIIGTVVGYVVLMFILHELFDKFFKILFFIGTILFVLGVVYYFLRGT